MTYGQYHDLIQEWTANSERALNYKTPGRPQDRPAAGIAAFMCKVRSGSESARQVGSSVGQQRGQEPTSRTKEAAHCGGLK